MTGSTDEPGARPHASARDAIARGEWQRAYDLLAEADASEPLPPQDLMLLADAAYGAGHLEVTLETLERAHTEALRADDRITAAAAGARLAMHLVIDTGLLAPVRGWVRRSERMLDGLAETPVHAWLRLARACERMLSGDFAAAWCSTIEPSAFPSSPLRRHSATSSRRLSPRSISPSKMRQRA